MNRQAPAGIVARVALILVVASGPIHAGETPDPVVPEETIAPNPPQGPSTPIADERHRTPPLDLSSPVIKRAIADSKDPLDDVVLPHGTTFGSGPPERQGTDQAFKRAEIPTCMTPEAYKFDPPQIGPFVLDGMLALPFLVHAIATGKCRY
jgi:hypothetical protein